ncbi:MAG: (2Fe-2S)-binding protein [Thermodesulfobacteriota bacterium]|jgi:carbon-monoxide dehydrogenase small subunit
MTLPIELKINGETLQVEIEPHESLVDVLRDRLNLTGTKKSCNLGNCGSCTVLLDGEPVNSCLVLALDARGKEIATIEGLARGEDLHPLQTAFVEEGAIQCGFCTPGMIMAAKGLLGRNPNPKEEEIREAIAGNMCRCTGYVKIVKAIQAASYRMQKRLRA